MNFVAKTFVLLAVLASATAKAIGTIGEVTRTETIQKLRSGSELVALYSEPAYVDPIYVLSLHGKTSYEQGFDAGILFGKQMIDNFNALFLALFGDTPVEPILQAVTELFMDWQWSEYLSKEVPAEYMDELSGLKAGGLAGGNLHPDLSKVASRGITLANLPGDVEDIIYVLIDEFANSTALTPEQRAVLPTLKKVMSHYNGHQCSMYGVWGSRTQDGNLYSARNLDWLTDLGINKYKLITVHHPPSGHAHATIGFAGIWGAMAGISNQGLTVHEANLEESSVTFKGFPWILRLRHVMAYSSNLDEATAIMKSTNNTVGFNFMVGSAADKRSRCMETQKGYTAYFDDMDPREDGAVDPATGEVYGFPLKDAVWRTNHGYDPVSQANYQWYTYSAYKDSKRRYKAIHDYFLGYETAATLIGATEAVTVTSAIGIKGDGSDEDNCNPDLYLKGENILSVTYDPTSTTIYAAFEDGAGDAWVPAACNGYIKIDMKQWF